MDLGLAGTRALVTASSKGLGRAVAAQLVDEGATVIISSSDRDNLADAKAAILENTDANENAVRTAVCDLSEPESIPSRLGPAIEDLGGLDVLVTNHGGTTPLSFEEADFEDFDDAYESVLKSTVATVKTALPHLKDGGGTITTLVAASALEPPRGSVLNSAIRPGLYGLSKSLADEYSEHGIRTNCVSPRAVLTDRIEYKIDVLADRENISREAARDRRTEELPIGRLGSPEEFARAVTFIASPAADFITGSVLQVDGGWHRHAF
ncbi:SDR family oxidoreductase [Natronosalvus halobius]|uniref:SDR family oxidoreductase n=1 Tax=Natronosalvus halobius TaxID=2953746 RepID=UPI0020A2123B|nr:SDR family oxidoreductase [Natronosalvus halobius]USZ73594.1 SDR family oxidoreductase [Natronosalvus halobius]